jgi:hypothetical protein
VKTTRITDEGISKIKLEGLAKGFFKLSWESTGPGPYRVYQDNTLFAFTNDLSVMIRESTAGKWSVFREIEGGDIEVQEMERCCLDVCHWCRMHIKEPQYTGPSEHLPGEWSFSHELRPGKNLRDRGSCNATSIRERWERMTKEQPPETPCNTP